MYYLLDHEKCINHFNNLISTMHMSTCLSLQCLFFSEIGAVKTRDIFDWSWFWESGCKFLWLQYLKNRYRICLHITSSTCLFWITMLLEYKSWLDWLDNVKSNLFKIYVKKFVTFAGNALRTQKKVSIHSSEF